MVASDLAAPQFGPVESPAERARKFAKKLREDTVAVKLSLSAFGRRRALNAEQVAKAAEAFGAESSVLKASKRLLNDKCPEFKAVVSALTHARQHWVEVTMPYPDKGVRLMKRDSLPKFLEKMAGYREQLQTAIGELETVYADLVEQAKEDLKDLFDPANYPASLVGAWSIDWEFPSVDPPEYLKQLSPELYEQQAAMIEARFSQAVVAAEQMFAAEFAKLVKGLIERLTPADVLLWTYEGELELTMSPDDPRRAICAAEDIEQREERVSYRLNGKAVRRKFETPEAARAWLLALDCRNTGTMQERRKMTEASVGNLAEFFEKFKSMSVGSNAELDSLIGKAQGVISGTNSDALRMAPDEARASIKATMEEIASRLEGMVVAADDRNIDFEE